MADKMKRNSFMMFLKFLLDMTIMLCVSLKKNVSRLGRAKQKREQQTDSSGWSMVEQVLHDPVEICQFLVSGPLCLFSLTDCRSKAQRCLVFAFDGFSGFFVEPKSSAGPKGGVGSTFEKVFDHC
mmetsp:Transcript_18602/g.26728  ORF Transcript_18602/g.26728 Transcript_18602/m.26728 type:complete len:125 (+) Transcript_18602:549-923(+)